MIQVKLVEYKYGDGQWNFKDSDMVWVYEHMEQRENTFYNVDVHRWNPLNYLKRCRVFLGYVLHENGWELSGLFWVSSWNPLNRNGFFNFSWIDTCRLNGFEKINTSMQGLRMLLDMSDFRVLYAETSVNRKAVLKFAEYMGFVQVGQIPGAHWHQDEQKFYDTILMYITKDTVRR